MDETEDRWYVVIIHNGARAPWPAVLSRRTPGPRGRFDGPWGALTQDEAEELAAAWNADRRRDGRAEVAEMYRYDLDPGWPDSEA